HPACQSDHADARYALGRRLARPFDALHTLRRRQRSGRHPCGYRGRLREARHGGVRMTASAAFLSFATLIALGLLCAALAIAAWRVIAGPTLPDRILALDMLVAVAIGFIAVVSIRSGYLLYVD